MSEAEPKIVEKVPEILPTIPEEPKEVVAEEKPKKEKKKRKPMTPEHKAKVMAGLAKARAASALARSKKSEVKKIKKANENEERDEIIRKDLLKKTQKSDEKDKRIAELEKKLASLTLQDVVKKPRKVKVIDTESEPVPEPPAQPAQPAQPEHSVVSHVQQAPVIQKKEPVAVASPAPVKVENQIKKAVYRGRGRRRG